MQPNPSSTQPGLKPLNILIVEDDLDYLGLMKEFFNRPEYTVKSASDGMQASGLIRSMKFDVIVMDVKIPSVNGLQVAAIARTSELNRNAAIYVLTGDADPSTRARAMSLKVDQFCTKPADLTELEKTIRIDHERRNRKVVYDVRVINAFIEAAAEIYEFYFQQVPSRGKVSILPKTQPSRGYVTGLIALTAETFVGSMGLNLPSAVVKKLGEILFAGMAATLDDAMIADITGEMCNQILGKVKFNFAKLGIKVIIGLPKVIMGEGHVVMHTVQNPVISIPMGKDNMVFELQFCLSQQQIKLGSSEDAEVPASSVILFE
jgi:CheY-like chemotaxis protein